LPKEASNPPSPPKPRGWSVVAAGLLLLAVALVVLFTNHAAFSSPLALVVLAAIGLAALLFQLRLNRDDKSSIHSPLWLNLLGLLFAASAVFADHLRMSSNLMMVAALGAVICFGISGTLVLRNLRKK
jgi:FtsH-binding integral membrane protein